MVVVVVVVVVVVMLAWVLVATGGVMLDVGGVFVFFVGARVLLSKDGGCFPASPRCPEPPRIPLGDREHRLPNESKPKTRKRWTFSPSIPPTDALRWRPPLHTERVLYCSIDC